MIRQSLKLRKTLTVLGILSLFLIIFLILTKRNSGVHQRIKEEDVQKLDRNFIDLPKKDKYTNTDIMENSMKVNSDIDGTKRELLEAQSRIDQLEKKIAILEGRVPQKFPDVKFLGYKERKRILVTGGAGFVGSHLVDVLMTQGHEVIVVDNFFTGRKRNVEHWFGHRNFEMIHHDIVNPLYVEADEIYHLASPASPPHYMQNPVKTIKTNTLGTINMLGLARRVGAKILIASTSEVYGDPMVHPQPESYWGHVNPIGPRACYDEGKRVAETLAYSYAKQEKVAVRVARIFNTYGPRMHVSDGRVVSNFIMQALQNLTITVYGNGKQTRSFCYVSDLVDGLLALMAANYTLPVNLGNPVENTIQEFAMIIKNQVPGCRSMVAKGAPVEDDPQRRRPDITVAKEHLHWEPKVDVLASVQRAGDRNSITSKRVFCVSVGKSISRATPGHLAFIQFEEIVGRMIRKDRCKGKKDFTNMVPLQDGLQRTIDYFKEELSSSTFQNNQTYMNMKS